MDSGGPFLIVAVVMGALLIVGAITIAQISTNRAARRRLSLDLVHQIRLGSPWYRRAVCTMRDLASRPRNPAHAGPGEPADAASRRDQSAGEVLYLLYVFDMLSVGMREGVLDERIIRSAFEADLELASELLRGPALEVDGRLEEVRSVAARWRHGVTDGPASAMQ
jgi:hypothetical protein